LYPNNEPGVATYRVLVWNPQDSANFNAVLTVDAVVEHPTGISDPTSPEVNLYPIPAKDVLNISFPASMNVTDVVIFNVVGQKIKSAHVENGSKATSLPVSDMKRGVYFLRLYSNGKDVY